MNGFSAISNLLKFTLHLYVPGFLFFEIEIELERTVDIRFYSNLYVFIVEKLLKDSLYRL